MRGVSVPPHLRRGSGPTGTDDVVIPRSEERMTVGTEKVQTGVARLTKRIVTENVTMTVPVSHETAYSDREPITDSNRAKAMTARR